MKKMMKLLLSACCFLLLTGGVFVATSTPQSYGWDSIPESYEAMLEKLETESINSGTNTLRFESLAYFYYNVGEEMAFSQIDGMKPCTEIIQWFITYEHAFGNHVEELKAMGYTNVDYTPVLSPAPEAPVTPPVTDIHAEPTVTPTETPIAAPTPLEFTVTPLEPPKTMWATQQVNYRDGADTTYNKVGQLNQHDQIIVTGIASTNWYQFSLDGGTTQVYASNNYFTDVDPSNRSVIIDNPETGDFSYYEFSETDPSLIDKAIEQLEEETAQKESELAEVTTEVPTEEIVETVAETIVESSVTQPLQTEELPVTVEVVEEKTEEPSTSITETVSQLSWTYIITAAILVGIIILGIVMIVKYSKK